MTPKVQYWQNGLMMGLISRQEADEMLKCGYKEINSQAIEWEG